MHRLLRFGLLAFDALLALFFVVGCAARWVDPRAAWWVQPVGVALPYLSMALLAAMLLAAFGCRWKLFGAHLVLALLMIVRFVPAQGFHWRAEPRPSGLTVMTYNVPHEWSQAAQAGKTQAALALVRRYAPDLISLQETRVTYTDAGRLRSLPFVEALIDALGYETIRVRREETVRTTQPVLGRFPIEEIDVFRLDVDPDDEITTRVVRAQFRWNGRPVALYNVHLRSFGRRPWQMENGSLLDLSLWIDYLRQTRAAYRDRAREAEELRALIARETLPVIVTGDFNSTMHNWVYRQIAAPLQDAFQIAGFGWGATYSAEVPFARIDFILAGPAFEVVSARVLENAGLSDHRPVIATLRWRSRGKGE